MCAVGWKLVYCVTKEFIDLFFPIALCYSYWQWAIKSIWTMSLFLLLQANTESSLIRMGKQLKNYLNDEFLKTVGKWVCLVCSMDLSRIIFVSIQVFPIISWVQTKKQDLQCACGKEGLFHEGISHRFTKTGNAYLTI